MNFEGDLETHIRAMKDRVPRKVYNANKESKMRNRDHVWRTGDGRHVRLEDMELDHLVNLLCWLQRQKEALRSFEEQLPYGYFQGSDVHTWINRVSDELARRRRKETKQAEKILGM